MKKSTFTSQVIPVGLTVVIVAILIVILWVEIELLNVFTQQKILLDIRLQDILVGTTIYLKTSIDFAIFMGNLMRTNPGWKNRIAIEIGTAVGNAAGTFAILAIWSFFKEIDWLLGIMVILASLVLFQLAEDGLEHAKEYDRKFSKEFQKFINKLETILHRTNQIFRPVLSKLIPHMSLKTSAAPSWKKLFLFSFTIPFILGLDDFAGYVPLFNIVNVFGFGIGVMVGHTILNILLFINPEKTIQGVKNPIISFAGSIAFIGLALWGLKEALHLLFHL